MSALAQANDLQEQVKSVTTISANARVDYILRFSKQAVLVVDEQPELCSDVGSQFLASLSNEHNAAYVSVSSKLNNIQVRCRLIEQLFHGELFDPEQSVAVSIINLAKQHRQPISIVVENSHLLSLQLIHELCQLAEVAKKADYQISVLMLGLPQTGNIVATNSALFRKKISILSAQTGQLLPLNSKLFKPKTALFKLTKKKIWASVFVVISLISIAVIATLFQKNIFSYSELNKNPPSLNNENLTVSRAKEVVSTIGEPMASTDHLTVDVAQDEATVTDIYSAIVNGKVEIKNVTNEPQQFAAVSDVLYALEVQYPANNQAEIELEQKEQVVDEENVATSVVVTTIDNEIKSTQNVDEEKSVIGSLAGFAEKKLSFIKDNSTYYLSKKQGFVIQLAGFTQRSTFDEFKGQVSSAVYTGYLKSLNDSTMLVVTSQVYPSREIAEQALSSLSEPLKLRQPWIKSIAAVKNEINAYQRSQSDDNQVTILNSLK